jgi:hypothetical protein
LDVLFGGLGKGKFQYLIKKLGKNCKFIFIFWSSKPWIRIRISIQPKMLDPDPESINPDPESMNPDPKHWLQSNGMG